MNDLPLVTIAIPTYNRVEYLKQALASAQAQTYPNLEIIVSDNASSDGTQKFMESIKDQRVSYIKQTTNIGMFGNWNYLKKIAKGEYLLILSDDDLLFPNAIKDLLINHESSNVVYYGRFNLIDKEKKVKDESRKSFRKESSESFIKHWFLGKRQIVPSVTLYKNRNLQSYDESNFNFVADLHLLMNLLLDVDYIYSTDSIMGSYRLHESSASLDNSNEKWIQDFLNFHKAMSNKIKAKKLSNYLNIFTFFRCFAYTVKLGFFTRAENFSPLTKSLLVEKSRIYYVLMTSVLKASFLSSKILNR